MATAFPAYVAQGAEHTIVRDFTPGADSNEPFIVGDFVFYDTTDNVMQRCGANPTLIAGLSEVSSAAATLLTPSAKVPVRLIVGAGVVIAFASATTPAVSHIGDSYGITRNAAGQWLLDTAKTTTSSRARIIDVDITNGIFFGVLHENLLQFADVEVATS